MSDSIDINKIIDTSNFIDSGIEGNTQHRSGSDAGSMVEEWRKNN